MIKYKIIEVNPAGHSIVVRYYTNVVTEAFLATHVGSVGEILRGRTDYNLDLPVPTPNAADLDRIIMNAAPKKWLETQENVLLNGPAQDLVALTQQIGILREEQVPTFAEVKAKFLLQVKTEAGALTAQVLKGLESEYELAEKESTAYKAAGYPATTIPSSVQSEINSKAIKGITITATVACDAILVSATSWRNAQAAMRDKRLTVSSAAEVAVDGAALDPIKAQWAGFMVYMRGQMGVA